MGSNPTSRTKLLILWDLKPKNAERLARNSECFRDSFLAGSKARDTSERCREIPPLAPNKLSRCDIAPRSVLTLPASQAGQLMPEKLERNRPPLAPNCTYLPALVLREACNYIKPRSFISDNWVWRLSNSWVDVWSMSQQSPSNAKVIITL